MLKLILFWSTFMVHMILDINVMLASDTDHNLHCLPHSNLKLAKSWHEFIKHLITKLVSTAPQLPLEYIYWPWKLRSVASQTKHSACTDVLIINSKVSTWFWKYTAALVREHTKDACFSNKVLNVCILL